MKNILRWCFKNITQKYPGRILIIALLLSGFSIYISTGLSYDSRMDNLLPKDIEIRESRLLNLVPALIKTTTKKSRKNILSYAVEKPDWKLALSVKFAPSRYQ